MEPELDQLLVVIHYDHYQDLFYFCNAEEFDQVLHEYLVLYGIKE